MPNQDISRVFDGFVEMSAGMNGGIAASLIQPNQCALARDFTFRGAYPKTRPAYLNHLFTFDSAVTQSHWVGKYQGSCWYQAGADGSGFVISRGGRLFFLKMGVTNVMSEITPQIVIVTTADFTAPNAALAPPGNMVVVSVVSETSLVVGDALVIDGDNYVVVSLAANSVTLQNVDAATGKVVPQGTTVFMSDGITPIKEFRVNPSWLDFVDLFQAETYVIILAENQSAVIFDGSSARLAGVGEVPSGVLGAYGWGRIWICLNDRRSFMAGDIVFGSSGTQVAGFRDAILKFTENDFYNEGGAFGVPANAGPITAMQFLATQDTSLGVGVLLVGTTNMIFSVNAPVDRTTWKNLQYPIQTISLLNSGPASPRGVTSVNGDMWYRATDGVHSFFVSRRDFGTWGNTPMSREISPILDYDTERLLYYGSAVLFDNRVLFTTSPFRTEIGVAHRGLVSDNFDLISSQQGKTQPAWEGAFTGLNFLQVVKATYDVGHERCFMFVANSDDEVEFWELQGEGVGTSDKFDNCVAVTNTRINPLLVTKSMTFEDGSQKKSLHSCEIFVDQIIGTVTLTIKFRPDQYPSWVTWETVTLCADVAQCSPSSDCAPWITHQKTYAARIMLTQPPETCNEIAGTIVREGYEFQFQLECSGSFRLRKFKPHAKLRTDKQEGDCASYSCKTFAACDEAYFNTDSHGDAPTVTIEITTTEIPDVVSGEDYSFQLEATGGSGNYVWVITSGSLPDGLTMSTSGLISGTTSDDGSFEIGLEVTDQNCPMISAVTVLPIVVATDDPCGPLPEATLLAYYKCEDVAYPVVDSVAGKDMVNVIGQFPNPEPGIILNGLFNEVSPSAVWRMANTDAQWDLSGEDGVTIRLWFWYDGAGTTTVDINVGSSTQQYYIRIFNPFAANWVQFVVNGGTPGSINSTAVIPPVIGWHRFIGIYRKNCGLSIKVDNETTAFSAIPDAVMNPGTTAFWVDTATTVVPSMPKAGLDEIAIWRGCLSEAQMLYDWNGGAGRTYPDVP